jgi:hypothetical protein
MIVAREPRRRGKGLKRVLTRGVVITNYSTLSRHRNNFLSLYDKAISLKDQFIYGEVAKVLDYDNMELLGNN